MPINRTSERQSFTEQLRHIEKIPDAERRRKEVNSYQRRLQGYHDARSLASSNIFYGVRTEKISERVQVVREGTWSTHTSKYSNCTIVEYSPFNSDNQFLKSPPGISKAWIAREGRRDSQVYKNIFHYCTIKSDKDKKLMSADVCVRYIEGMREIKPIDPELPSGEKAVLTPRLLIATQKESERLTLLNIIGQITIPEFDIIQQCGLVCLVSKTEGTRIERYIVNLEGVIKQYWSEKS